MNKTIAVFILITIMLTIISVTDAQQSKKGPRLGYLSPFEPARESSPSEANSAGSARAWLRRRTEHRRRVPICGGEGRLVT